MDSNHFANCSGRFAHFADCSHCSGSAVPRGGCGKYCSLVGGRHPPPCSIEALGLSWCCSAPCCYRCVSGCLAGSSHPFGTAAQRSFHLIGSLAVLARCIGFERLLTTGTYFSYDCLKRFKSLKLGLPFEYCLS